MSLYKDSASNNWYISLYDENGKRIRSSTGTSSKRKAQGIHDDMAHRIRLTRLGLAPQVNAPKQPEIPRVLLSDFADKYDEFQRAKYQPKTAEAGRSAFASLKRFYDLRKADPHLVDISVGEVEEWQIWVLSTSAPATLDIHFRMLRAAFNRAVRWGDTTANPFAGSERPRINTDEDEESVRYFEPEQLAKLFQVTTQDPRWHAMVKFYLYSGMRRQELTHLEWTDIDLKAQEITIHGAKTIRLPQIKYTLGKRAYTLPACGYRFRTKNGKRRTIPVNDRFMDLIGELQGQRKEYMGLDQCPLVFPAMRTACQNRVWYPNRVTTRFRKFLVAAGLPDSFTLHSLRHTFASRLVQKGKSLYQVGELLGHNSLEVTKIYSHLTPKSLHPVVEDLDFEIEPEQE